MKMRTLLALGVFVFLAGVSGAVETPASKTLEDQLQELGTPGDQAPVGLTSEKLYAVQNRFSPLGRRFEIAGGAGTNFSSSSFLISRNFDLSARMYFSDRWYAGLSGNYVLNQFTKDGEDLVNNPGLVPDVGVVLFRTDLTVGYNLFYGKFRVTMDKVFYFDHYVALGAGVIWQELGRRLAAVGDTGIAMRFGRNLSLRVGVKDYFFDEQRKITHSFTHNFVGYMQAGYVFGG